MSLTPRVKVLRDRMVETPAICLERGRYMTESYKQTEGQPAVLRRAKALDNILSKMSVRFEGDEILAGWETSKMRGGALLTEVKSLWLLDELDTVQDREFDRYQPLTEAEKEEVKEMLPYWKGKTINELWETNVPEELHKFENIIQKGGYARNGHQQAHAAPYMQMVLEKGLKGTLEDLDRRIAELDLSVCGNLERWQFYQGAKITQKAVIKFANRYADLAEQTAKEETRPWRKAELEKLAEICRWVPENPARTFYEAVQCAWFIYIACMIECWGAGISMGRIDQYLYPYYKADKAAGILTDDQAKEILSYLLVKMNGGINLQQGFMQQGANGYPVMKGMTIGGVTPEGRDAVNDVTYLILDVEEDVGLTSEDIVVRINHLNPDKYVVRAVEVAKKLHGKLKFVSDTSTIQSILYLGLPLKYARDYISTGCHNPGIPGIAHFNGGTMFHYPMMLELALNNGVRRLTGMRVGPETGDPRKFKSYEEVEQAFYKQFDSCLWVGDLYRYVDNKIYAENTPCPLLSSFYKGCLEKGLDIYAGGTGPYDVSVLAVNGIPNIADSLAAIKKLVFDDKVITMDEMMDAVEANFEGETGEKVYHLIQRTPKFGNDDEYVDSIAARILDHACEKVWGKETYGGRKSSVACLGMTANLPLGEMMWATPDGRRTGEPLSEGGISPYQGRNVSGATATMNSVCRLDQVQLTNGSILNMRIADDLIKNEEGVKRFAQMLRAFCENGGNLVQFNFTNNAILKDAQIHPDNYRDLLVRVATYSAYFVELSPVLQDCIIERNELN